MKKIQAEPRLYHTMMEWIKRKKPNKNLNKVGKVGQGIILKRENEHAWERVLNETVKKN